MRLWRSRSGLLGLIASATARGVDDDDDDNDVDDAGDDDDTIPGIQEGRIQHAM